MPQGGYLHIRRADESECSGIGCYCMVFYASTSNAVEAMRGVLYSRPANLTSPLAWRPFPLVPPRSESSLFQIIDLGTLAERRWSHALDSHGISVGEHRVLAVLVERGPQTAVEIIPRVTLEQSLVSRTLHRLYDKGLISRRRSRTDRRSVTLRATADGEQLVRRLAELLQEVTDEVCRGVPERELLQARQVAAALLDNLE